MFVHSGRVPAEGDMASVHDRMSDECDLGAS